MFPKIKITIVILIVVFIAALVAAYYFYGQYSALKKSTEVQSDLSAPKTPQEEIDRVLARVGRHILLPEEQATVATVTDVEALRSQPFFVRAKNGDKVLIFPIAKMAILYDPVADKIVQIGPFSAQDVPGSSAPEDTSTLKK